MVNLIGPFSEACWARHQLLLLEPGLLPKQGKRKKEIICGILGISARSPLKTTKPNKRQYLNG